MRVRSMFVISVRMNVARWVVTLLMAMAMLSPWTPEISAQEPLDSVIPIDSLVVTVLRATDGLGRAPYAVTVQGERALRLGNTGFSLEEALQGVPGIHIQNRYNYTVGERISIRGFGARTPFGIRGITTLVDGIPATMADGQTFLDHLDFGSLGRVEVLRGPSAAMYGNGGGGVLSFQTRPPPDVPIREEATAIFGENGLMRFQSTTSGTAGGAAYLFNIAHLTYDGFRTVVDSSAFTEERSDSSLYGLTKRLNINGQVGLDAGAGRLLFTGTFMDLEGENAGQINRTKMYTDSVQDAHVPNIAQNASKDVYQGQFGATWTGPVANLNAEFVGWGLFRRMDNPIPPAIIDLSRNAFGARAMVSNDTSGDLVTWAAGFDLNFQRDDRMEYDNIGGVKGDLEVDQFETVGATGLFVQAAVGLGDRTTLEGGLRYNRFNFEVEDRFTSDGDDSGERVMDQLSPTVGLVVRATPDLSVFGNFATSLATPTTVQLNNTLAGTGGINSDLNAQTGRTGEIGLRGQAGSTFSYEMSGFLSKIKNELIQLQDSTGRDFYDNAGESTYQGIEMSVRMALPEGVFGQLSYTFMDAKFDEYVDADENDFAGNFVPGVPRHRFDGLVRYSRGFWYAEVRGDHVGKTYTNDANRPNSALHSYTLWDLRAGLSGQPVGNNMEVAPFVSLTNVFDAVYSSGYQPNAFGGPPFGPPGGQRYYEPGPRRAFSAGLTVTFQ